MRWLLLILAGATAANDCTGVVTLSADDTEWVFEVEIAADDASRQRGLMFREELGSHAGMLFLFPDMRMRGFWMKNTPLPLDIAYFADGLLVNVALRATPFSEAIIPSDDVANMVLEVNAGAFSSVQGTDELVMSYVIDEAANCRDWVYPQK